MRNFPYIEYRRAKNFVPDKYLAEMGEKRMYEAFVRGTSHRIKTDNSCVMTTGTRKELNDYLWENWDKIKQYN